MTDVSRLEALVYSAIQVLEPIADFDWVGKWRVQKALAFLRADGDQVLTPGQRARCVEVIDTAYSQALINWESGGDVGAFEHAATAALIALEGIATIVMKPGK